MIDQAMLEAAIVELRKVADEHRRELEALAEDQSPCRIRRAFWAAAEKWGDDLVSRMLPACGHNGAKSARRAAVETEIRQAPAFVDMCDDLVACGLLKREAEDLAV